MTAKDDSSDQDSDENYNKFQKSEVFKKYLRNQSSEDEDEEDED